MWCPIDSAWHAGQGRQEAVRTYFEQQAIARADGQGSDLWESIWTGFKDDEKNSNGGCDLLQYQAISQLSPFQDL